MEKVFEFKGLFKNQINKKVMNKKNDYNKRTGELNVILTMTYSEFQDLRSFIGITCDVSPERETMVSLWPILKVLKQELNKD